MANHKLKKTRDLPLDLVEFLENLSTQVFYNVNSGDGYEDGYDDGYEDGRVALALEILRRW